MTGLAQGIAFFDAMGNELEEQWRRADYAPAVFPELCVTLLNRRRPNRNIDPSLVVDWILRAPTIPLQLDVDSKFGQPAYTVFAGRRFHIDVYFWTEGTTAIHQHGFSGAFHVMAGSSIHGTFDWKTTRAVNASLQVGRLSLRAMELLRPGATRPILMGSGLIHSLFHLDRPSVTVTVRTYEDRGAAPQWSYHPPSIAIDPFYDGAQQKKMLQVLRLLHEVSADEFTACAARLIHDSDLHTAYLVLGKCLELTRRLADVRGLLAGVRGHHAWARPAFATALEERARSSWIIHKRNTVHQRDHRLFLAILLNAPTRRAALDLIRASYPGEPPFRRVMQWLTELAGQAPDKSAPSLLGFDLDETALFIFKRRLEGQSLPRVLSGLSRAYSKREVRENVTDIRALYKAIESSALFQPLFRE